MFFNKDIENYINANLQTDLHSLLLKKSPFPEVSMQEIVQQIKGRKIAEKKFSFLQKEGIIFPPNLNLEQASSEVTAYYKSLLAEGKTMIDLTCGFGIDAFFLSKNFEETTLVEQNKELLKIVEHNWNVLNRNAIFKNDTLENVIKNTDSFYDLIYLDPARRNAQKKKVFLLEDLSPNLLEIKDRLLDSGRLIMIKLSPLIDLKYLVKVLPELFRIDIVAVKNEVKEVLIQMKSDKDEPEPKIRCVNLETNEPEFTFLFSEEENATAEFSDVQNYMYLPNNAILKSGAFQITAQNFNLKKLHPNTHIYTSEQLVSGFPGRIFKTEEITTKDLKKGEKYNIISKNHPLKPEEIKKKFKIRDGGNDYLIFTQSLKGKIIIKSVSKYCQQPQ